MKFSRSRPILHFHNREAQIGLLDRVFVRNEGKNPVLIGGCLTKISLRFSTTPTGEAALSSMWPPAIET